MPLDNLKDKKLTSLEFGNFAEEKTSEFYANQGYAILERNWRLGKTEIDLIAQKDDVIAFIEVKARKSSLDDALSSVTRDKRRRMIKAADSYIRRQIGTYQYRFDIVACSGDKENFKMVCLEDAFLAADIY